MSKGPGKLIAFLLAYALVAYFVLVILGVLLGGDITGTRTLLAAVMIALATVLFDEKATIPPSTMMAVRLLLVPVALAWGWLAWQAVQGDFPAWGVVWHPIVVLLFFIAPAFIRRRRRTKRH